MNSLSVCRCTASEVIWGLHCVWKTFNIQSSAQTHMCSGLMCVCVPIVNLDFSRILNYHTNLVEIGLFPTNRILVWESIGVLVLAARVWRDFHSFLESHSIHRHHVRETTLTTQKAHNFQRNECSMHRGLTHIERAGEIFLWANNCSRNHVRQVLRKSIDFEMFYLQMPIHARNCTHDLTNTHCKTSNRWSAPRNFFYCRSAK